MNLAILHRPKSFDPVVEQTIEPSAEAFGLLVSEIGDMEGGILKSPSKVRSAHYLPVCYQVSKQLPEPCAARNSKLQGGSSVRWIARHTPKAMSKYGLHRGEDAEPVARWRRSRQMISFRQLTDDRVQRGVATRKVSTHESVTYTVVEHDGGWAYKVGAVFSEAFPTHEAAHAAAVRAAEEQRAPGQDGPIEYEDDSGKWREEQERGDDRPNTDVKD